MLFYLSLKVTLRIMCQPCFSSGKETTCSAGDLGLIPGLGRSPGKGEGYLLQYFIFGLENSIDYSPWGCKELDMTERLSVHFCLFFSWENWSSESLITLTRISKSELRFEPKSLLFQSCPNIAWHQKRFWETQRRSIYYYVVNVFESVNHSVILSDPLRPHGL